MLKPDTVSLTALLALLTAFGPVATDMYVPSMPEIGRLLLADPAMVQLTLSSYLIGFAAGQVVYGPVLIALALFCLASFACAVAPTIEALIAARAVQAFGGAGAPLAIAVAAAGCLSLAIWASTRRIRTAGGPREPQSRANSAAGEPVTRPNKADTGASHRVFSVFNPVPAAASCRCPTTRRIRS